MVVRQSDLQIFLLEIVSIFLLWLIVQLYSVLYIPLQHYIHNEQRAEIRINQKEEDLHHDSEPNWPYYKHLNVEKQKDEVKKRSAFFKGLPSWNHVHSIDFSRFDQIWRKQELRLQCHFETSNAQLQRSLSK